VLATLADRRQLLSDNYYFTCLCSRCSAPNLAGTELSDSYLSQVQGLINEAEMSLNAKQVDSMKRLLSVYLSSWRSKNISDMSIVFKMGEILMDHSFKVGSIKEAFRIAVDYMTEGYATYLPEYHPMKGLLFYKISLIAEDLTTARNYFKKV
jgi:hypothetical protein